MYKLRAVFLKSLTAVFSRYGLGKVLVSHCQIVAALVLLLAAINADGQTHLKVRKDTAIRFDPYNSTTYLKPIPFNRQLFHDKIDKEVARADGKDGALDHHIDFKPDPSMSDLLTRVILKDANHLQIMIENLRANGRDSFSDHQERIRYLNAVYELLSDYNNDKKVDAYYYKRRVDNLHDMIIASNENRLMRFAEENANIYSLANGKLLFDNHKDVRAYLYIRLGQEDPRMMIRRLKEYANDTFASTIISADAKLEPDFIFNYATSTDRLLTGPVHRTQDPLVQAIVEIADQSKSPLKAMPFLTDVYHKRKTVAQIDAIADDADLYFKSLVALKLTGDSIGRYTYTQELQIRALKYVREMNELHEEHDEVRFKCIENMSAVELYYIMVSGQDEIYTSSFLGTFKRTMDKMKPLRGDQLLDTLHYDHFRTFIRMCAGYNTLSDFLQTMSDSSRGTLMAGFIDNLQKGREDDLEDAVDVADAFGSITDSALSAFLEKKVKENYELSYKERSKKGLIIYSLLARLFQGSKITNSDTGAAVASNRLGLPQINKVAYKDLVNDSGIVYQQVFFYGDKDGKQSYDHFMELFRKDARWKSVPGTYWTTIYSTNGKIVIFANLPLPEPDDDVAIDTLDKFLFDSGIHPTIMIHRGHSYHLAVTLQNLERQARIVVLGSCGGYHNLAAVLDKSPAAHIVSSKQTGTMGVNDEILRSLNNKLLAGENIDWITMWADLEDYFNKKHDPADKDKFSDYVPPYKNLGAIFIKAYRRMITIY